MRIFLYTTYCNMLNASADSLAHKGGLKKVVITGFANLSAGAASSDFVSTISSVIKRNK